MIKFVIQTRNFPCKAHVIEGSTYVILNRDFLKKYSSKIDFDKVFIELSSEEIRFLFMVLKLMIQMVTNFAMVSIGIIRKMEWW